MLIITDHFEPYDFNTKFETLKYVVSAAHGLKKSIRRVEKDKEHLRLRCPLSGDYIDILGSSEELNWLDKQLYLQNWYRSI